MPHDSARVEHTRLWIEKAESDIKCAEWNLKAKPPGEKWGFSFKKSVSRNFEEACQEESLRRMLEKIF